jgi:hypothetical protein
MTTRSEFSQRKREAQAIMLGVVVNRVLSKKTTGVDGVAKSLVARQIGVVDIDPDLDHPAEWDWPIE